MWRWSWRGSSRLWFLRVFSTYVEVILIAFASRHSAWCILHVCGGDPHVYHARKGSSLYSPRMWRWSPTCHHHCRLEEVFSTYVEVILRSSSSKSSSSRILHVCGGDPKKAIGLLKEAGYSPRMWRWSYGIRVLGVLGKVFSTYVEVILAEIARRTTTNGILHVCGGDPLLWSISANKLVYSPRMWRWSYYSLSVFFAKIVFSTYVEVIPTAQVVLWLFHWYSPRMWRWSQYPALGFCYQSVFSTYVEVIPNSQGCSCTDQSILHVCGGDPISLDFSSSKITYSPRMWRWSLYCGTQSPKWLVFSTYVEVIPSLLQLLKFQLRILHVCGGDPIGSSSGVLRSSYSPRMWRWSQYQHQTSDNDCVFSTYVEVILLHH